LKCCGIGAVVFEKVMVSSKRNPKSSPMPFQRSPLFGLLPHDELKLFNYMVDNIGDELMLINKDGSIAYVNESAVRGLGFSRRVLLSKNITEFFKQKISSEEWTRTSFLPLKKSRRPVTSELERVAKGNKAEIIEVTAVYMRYGMREYILSIGRDITQRKEKEQRVQETNKMKALSLFVSGTAQEIKHPLEVVLAHSQAMLNKYRNREFEYIGFKEFNDIINAIRSIAGQVQYCHDITTKLLVLNKKKAGIQTRGCDINATIRNSMNIFSPQFKLANVSLKLQLAENLPRAAIDSIEMDEVAMNIAANAVQAMPGGGVFAVKTSSEKRGGAIRVDFKDTGIGIPQESLSRVFEPFFTTKPVGPGHNAGLGLSVVSSIIKGCHGQVSIDSSLRSGTVVKVILPILKTSSSEKSKKKT